MSSSEQYLVGVRGQERMCEGRREERWWRIEDVTEE
jgi:hypothetical protein